LGKEKKRARKRGERGYRVRGMRKDRVATLRQGTEKEKGKRMRKKQEREDDEGKRKRKATRFGKE